MTNASTLGWQFVRVKKRCLPSPCPPPTPELAAGTIFPTLPHNRGAAMDDDQYYDDGEPYDEGDDDEEVS